MNLKKAWSILLVSFVEGGAVMSVELVGAKMVAPFYGNSLYVWAAVLGLTLGGLATGYYFGGNISEKYPHQRSLHIIVLITAILIALMPVTSQLIMTATLPLELRLGITLSCLVFLYPPLVCCGMVSPLIIRLLATELSLVGRAAGTVYAISTLGGIIVTFLMGFYFIPFVGLKASALYTALILGIFPVIYFTRSFLGKPAT